MPEITAAADPQKPHSALPADRTERYCLRLDTFLETLPDDAARLAVLEAQHLGWIARYERFCARVDAGEEPHWGENAADYVCTIAEIGKRKALLMRRPS